MQRRSDRRKLEEDFSKTGGFFIETKDGQDPTMQSYITSVPEEDLQVTALTNIQKDMSDKTFDVKLFEVKLKTRPGSKKLRCEIFWIDEPSIIYRCDMLSDHSQDGSHMIIEKFNLIERLYYLRRQKKLIAPEGYDPSIFTKDGLVLAMHESSFPHSINVMLIEPRSHIQWEYELGDDKVNVIESRRQRKNFVHCIQTALEEGILRDVGGKDSSDFEQLGSQMYAEDKLAKNTFYHLSVLESTLISQSSLQREVLLYSRSLQVQPKIFRHLDIKSDSTEDSLIL